MHAMDYPSCRDFQAHSQKYSQYYPDQYGCSAYSTEQRVSSNEKRNYLYCQDSFRRLLSASNHYTDRKSPIYVHKYERMPNTAQENLYQTKNSRENPKVMLDKLEENYWATWKPKNSYKSNKNVAHGDTHESLFKYFSRCDYDTSSSLVQETCDHHHQKNADSYHVKDFQVMYKSNRQMQTAKTYHDVNASENSEQPEIIDEINSKNLESVAKDAQPISMNDQEIQTEYNFPSGKEIKEIDDKSSSETKSDKEPSKHTDKNTKSTKSHRKEKRHRKKAKPDIKEIFVEATKKCEDSTEDTSVTLIPEKVDKEVKGVEDDIAENKLLRHKDSFIIHRKKQSEVKEFLQQPKCIRLYRKSAPSFISKGGSYPLRSCLKKETGFLPVKGNFRLGAPGKPLFVTNCSYSRYM